MITIQRLLAVIYSVSVEALLEIVHNFDKSVERFVNGKWNLLSPDSSAWAYYCPVGRL